MQVPYQLLDALQGVRGFDREAFEAVHNAGANVTSIRINPAKIEDVETILPGVGKERVGWTDHGYYLSHRPSFTFDPLFHAGCYYVQEASSMFLEFALKNIADLSQPLKVLDLSAAPGGKSTHLQSLLSPDSLLLANEVIRNRCLVLADNLVKWGGSNAMVTNNDPSAFKKLNSYFDVVVVDAPCSGSGLFRKDPEAVSQWSESAVHLCSQRQQRILADVLPSLKQGGVLIYSTCSYSVEEDEAIGEWLVEEMGLEGITLPVDPATGIIATGDVAPGYRFYPHRLKGEGFFLSCFRKIDGDTAEKFRPVKLEKLTGSESSIVKEWLDGEDWCLFREKDLCHAVPLFMESDYAVLRAMLNVQYRGIALGNIMKNKLVPNHALAVNRDLSTSVEQFDIDYEQAILYLQRGEMRIEPKVTGWQVVRYMGHRLGWINALGNRINNYYPKEIRILKQQNDSGFEK